MLENMSDHSKSKVDDFVDLFQRVQRFRVENERYHTSEKPIEDHNFLTNEQISFVRAE